MIFFTMHHAPWLQAVAGVPAHEDYQAGTGRRAAGLWRAARRWAAAAGGGGGGGAPSCCCHLLLHCTVFKSRRFRQY